MNPQKHLKQLRLISLREDKTKGYGGSSRKFIDPFLPRFKVITYKKGPYLVIDRYTGEEQNIGQAITFYRKRPVYGVNYYGFLQSRKFKAKAVYQFLKKALRAGAGVSVHRGLDGYKENGWVYRNSHKETIKGFVDGKETIFYKGKLIYIQVYHGGVIEDSRTYQEWSRKLLSANYLREEIKF